MRPQHTRKSRHSTSFWEYQKEGSSHRRVIAGGYLLPESKEQRAESNVARHPARLFLLVRGKFPSGGGVSRSDGVVLRGRTVG